MMKKNILIVCLILTSSITMFSQTGTIRGIIKDGEFDDVMLFVNVVVEGTDKGVTSDFEGAYEITMPTGTQPCIFFYRLSRFAYYRCKSRRTSLM